MKVGETDCGKVGRRFTECQLMAGRFHPCKYWMIVDEERL